jgi:hypothetical protein
VERKLSSTGKQISKNCYNSMVCFDTTEAAALSKEEMESLVVRGSGSDIKAKL